MWKFCHKVYLMQVTVKKNANFFQQIIICLQDLFTADGGISQNVNYGKLPLRKGQIILGLLKKYFKLNN